MSRPMAVLLAALLFGSVVTLGVTEQNRMNDTGMSHHRIQPACHSLLVFLGAVVPPGFRVSPSRAYAIARDSRRSSLHR